MEAKKRKLITRCFIGFLIFIAAITYISRTIYVWRLPKVVLGFSEPGTFVRSYKIWGTVALSEEYSDYGAVTEFFIPVEDLPSINQKFIHVGEKVYLDIKSVEYAQFTGTVISVDFNEGGACITVGYNIVPAGNAPVGRELDIKGEEDILATFERKQYPYVSIVPSSAVHRDGQGYYVFTVHEEKGPMGREFVVKRQDVYIEDELDGRTALVEPIEHPIIIYQDSSVSYGDRVRFYP
ncbi:MAG: hypothetical protein ACOYI1_08010 [Caldicoprobacteraceae bacterium]|jgi:hypothetical protein